MFCSAVLILHSGCWRNWDDHFIVQKKEMGVIFVLYAELWKFCDEQLSQ